MKKVLLVGVFDMFHFGHLRLLKRASQLGDYLIVAIQSSDAINKYKSSHGVTKTLYSHEERVEMIRALRCVDEIISYSDVGVDIKNIDFDIFVKGPDQVHSGFVVATKWCEENGKEVVIIPRTEGISSTYLKRIIEDLEVKND